MDFTFEILQLHDARNRHRNDNDGCVCAGSVFLRCHQIWAVLNFAKSQSTQQMGSLLKRTIHAHFWLAASFLQDSVPRTCSELTWTVLLGFSRWYPRSQGCACPEV